MKTICLALNLQDRSWLKEYYKKNHLKEEIVIVAPNFEGKFLLSSIDLPHKTYETIAWGLDYNRLYNTAREKSYDWQFIEDISFQEELNKISQYNDYPLLTMQQPNIMLPLYEILQTREFIEKIFELESPQKIVFSQRINPFGEQFNRYFILTGSNGLERECAKYLGKKNGISVLEIPKMADRINIQKLKKISLSILDKLGNFSRNPSLFFDLISSRYKQQKYEQLLKSDIVKIKRRENYDTSKSTILMFLWGGYFLEYFEDILDILSNKVNFVIVIIDEDEVDITIRFINKYREKGMLIFGKKFWKIENEKGTLDRWDSEVNNVIQSIQDNPSLSSYFSDENGSYFKDFAFPVIQKELTNTLPKTVIDLIRSESIIDEIRPDLVIAHFSIYPGDACDVLPARILGIPTLTLEHGISPHTESIRDTFSTEYIAVAGIDYQKALSQLQLCSKNKIFPTGDSRLESIEYKLSIKEAKAKFDLDIHSPVAIFCDCSGWTHDGEARHSTWKTVQEIISLKKQISNLQIIYRVHHGITYDVMKEYFKDLNIPGIIFQVSPNPLFVDIVQAADLVIAHRTSAITEALLCGVPVIYLCSLSRKEPMYFDCEAITIVDNFETLPQLVKAILSATLSREQILEMARPYFQRVISGNDGKANERLINLILQLLKSSKDRKGQGFQDWVDRVELSCKLPIEMISPNS